MSVLDKVVLAPLAVVGRKRSLADVPRNLDESAADHALRKA